MTLAPDANMDVPPHPHIGLSTLTYLLEGTILHKDSLGTELEITAGAVNWMTAGRGITHSERTPERLRGSRQSLHGLQLWVALPKSHEQDEPSFAHIPAQDIPGWEMDGIACKLIAGQALGHQKL
jgi:redox-sensitive bicupin YhaK (pirin superfamily)